MKAMRYGRGFFGSVKNLLSTWIVAFRVEVHNFYKQEMDSRDSIVSSIEVDAEVNDDSPKE